MESRRGLDFWSLDSEMATANSKLNKWSNNTRRRHYYKHPSDVLTDAVYVITFTYTFYCLPHQTRLFRLLKTSIRRYKGALRTTAQVSI